VLAAVEGVDIVQGLHDTPYGAREVIVRTGGHYIIFAQLSLKANPRRRFDMLEDQRNLKAWLVLSSDAS